MTATETVSYINKLNDYQLDVFQECLQKVHSGINIPMGAGKTRLSLILSLEITEDKILVICEKTLVDNWIDEIEKVFEGNLTYYVYHIDYDRHFDSIISIEQIRERVIITTPEMCRKFYKQNNLEDRLVTRRVVNEGMFGQHDILDYNKTPRIVENGGLIYGTKWGSLIVDEFHKVGNITSGKSRAILCICADRKWALSGTFFTDGKKEKILSYFVFIQDEEFPNNLPDTERKIKNPLFDGLNRHIVIRTEAPVIIPMVEETVMVNLTRDEERVYTTFRDIVIDLSKKAKELIGTGNTEQLRRLNGYIMALLIYLRQSVVNPIIPLTSIFLKICNLNERDELSKILKDKFEEINVTNYLYNTDNIISRRMQRTIEISEKHSKVVIFTPFRKNIELIRYQVTNRDFFTIEGTMNMSQRSRILENTKQSDDFVLALTYKVGGSGLNLQHCNCVIFLDYDWSSSDTKQARTRVQRQGQKQLVYVYYIVSNTGVENAVLKKQLDKATISKELEEGPMKSKVDLIKIQEIVGMLEEEKINEKINKLYR